MPWKIVSEEYIVHLVLSAGQGMREAQRKILRRIVGLLGNFQQIPKRLCGKLRTIQSFRAT
jgi:hypothetical protein